MSNVKAATQITWCFVGIESKNKLATIKILINAAMRSSMATRPMTKVSYA